MPKQEHIDEIADYLVSFEVFSLVEIVLVENDDYITDYPASR